jgi:hypothetical protein
VDGRGVTLVEFTAYDGWLSEIQQLLDSSKDGGKTVRIRKCLTHAAPN